MYNGVGLETPRGSGTSGYVQRNLALLRNVRQKADDYKTEDQLKWMDDQLKQRGNKELLEHDRKRRVEVKCTELEDLMEEQGYNDTEIQEKVKQYRELLLEESKDQPLIENDEFGRPIAKATHELKEARQEKMQDLRQAFGIGEYYLDGSSFDPNRKQKEMEAKELALKEYKYIKDEKPAVEDSQKLAIEDKKDEGDSIAPEEKKKRSHHKKKHRRHSDDRHDDDHGHSKRRRESGERHRRKEHRDSSDSDDKHSSSEKQRRNSSGNRRKTSDSPSRGGHR